MKTHYIFRTASAFGLAVGLTLTQAASAETATNVFSRYFVAAGGREAFEKIDSIFLRGTGHERASEFNFQLSQKKPGRMHMVISNDVRALMQVGRDEQAKLWQASPEMGVRELPREAQGEYMNFAMGLFPANMLFMSEALSRSVCIEVRDQGRTLVALGEESKSAPFPRLMFDKESGLLVRVGDVRLSDYRAVNGIKIPFKIKPDANSEFQVEQVELNAQLQDSVFRRPGETGPGTVKFEKDNGYETRLSQPGKLEIVRKPEGMRFGRGKLNSVGSYNPDSSTPFQVDLRGYDLRALQLKNRSNDLSHADFDSATKWPEALPAGFDHDRILQVGRNPGLGVSKLHERGIQGQGIGIGIIDQTLLVDHAEYADRLRLYEEIHNPQNCAQMHGPAVASIAAGKTVGVAPKADLYYIAETHGVFHPGDRFDWDFTWLAKSIDRLLEVNATLPKEKKIRVISISVGWMPDQKGYQDAMAAVERATKQNVFVISTAISDTHKLQFHGLGRDEQRDPNSFDSYGPGSWWASRFWSGQMRFEPGERLLVPMDSRTTASPTGSDEYVFYANGGWSWSVPWIAGLYALACEVKPDITPEVFWAEALKTGRTITVRHDEKEIPFGTVADPVTLIEKLKKQ